MKLRPRRSSISGRGWWFGLLALILIVSGLSYVRILQWMHANAGRAHQGSSNFNRRRFSSQTEYDQQYQATTVPVPTTEIDDVKKHDGRGDVKHNKNDGAAPSSLAPSSEAVDVHLFVIWHGAMSHREAILVDMAKRFTILDVKYFDWTSDVIVAGRQRSRRPPPPRSHDDDKKGSKGLPVNVTALEEDYFLMNLWRLYNGKGGATKQNMPLKVRQCGRGPFIAAVVVDENPVYQDENTAHGTDHVNHHMNAAKARYRKWSGGGFRVHGTFNPQEAAHDITLLFHKHPDEYVADYQKGVVASAMDGVAQQKHSSASSHRSSEEVIRPFLGNRFDTIDHRGPDGTLGYHDDALMSGWANCSVMLRTILAPWTAVDRRRMVNDGFYGWDSEAAYPGAALNPAECDRWPSTEWAMVVPESAWWAMASLLNARWGDLAAGVLNDGKPDVIPVPIAGVVHQIHLRGYAPSAAD